MPGLKRVLIVLLALLATPAAAVDLHRGCFGLTATAMPPTMFDCKGAVPRTAKGQWLWFRARADVEPISGPSAVMVRAMTFDAVRIEVRYGNGTTHVQELRRGNYANRWVVAGRILLPVPQRDAPVTDVTVGFLNAPMPYMLAARLMSTGAAIQRSSLAATLVGGSLALLLFSVVYNIGLAVGARRPVLFWHAGWALCVLVWGTFSLQLALAVFPGLAGPDALNIANAFAAASIGCYGMLLAGSLEPGMIDRPLRGLVTGLAVTIPSAGLLNAFGPLDWQPGLHDVMRGLVLTAATTAFAALLIAIRRGSVTARDMAITWTLPMLAVAWAMTGNVLIPADDGGYFAVLTISALQAIGLSVAIGRRLASARQERETTRVRQQELERLAETDPLTGVFNRRGFVSRADAALAAGEGSLVLLDIDRFKAINDSHGHQVGDRALEAVARILEDSLPPGGCVGRLGGEEFGLFVPHIDKAAAVLLAERARESLAALANPGLTASFGVACSRCSLPDFQTLYRDADRALYAAKAAGRDRVMAAEPA